MSENAEIGLEPLRIGCHNKAKDAFGTAYLYQRRSSRITLRLNILTYVGLLSPVAIGVSVGVFGLSSEALPIVVTTAGTVGAIQIVVFLWSVVEGWVNKNSYAKESAAANSTLAMRYKQLADNPPETANEMRRQMELLNVEDTQRRARDDADGVSESERRMGMRAALRQYQQECSACKNQPTSLQPTDCGVCGQFGLRYRLTGKVQSSNG